MKPTFGDFLNIQKQPHSGFSWVLVV